MMNRRQALKTTALAATACAASLGDALSQPAGAPAAAAAPTGPFTVPPLSYAYDALEPHIDARTMQIHHDKHHGAYVANLNKAVAGHADLDGKTIEELMRNLDAIPAAIREAVRNNGGGHLNHSLFWQMMKKDGGGEPTGDFAAAIDKQFGSFAAFKQQFSDAAAKRFGSGWAWLVLDDRKLAIESTPNQDTPWSMGRQPLLGIDVWEHAYYLHYQNVRADYIKAWFNVVNWDFPADRFRKLTTM